MILNMKKIAFIAALGLLAVAASAQPKVVGHRGPRLRPEGAGMSR